MPIVLQFYAAAQNEYGTTAFSDKITVTVKYDCLVDEIKMLTRLPKDAEISLDPNLSDFVEIDNLPVLKIVIEEKSMTSYQVGVSK